MEKIIEISQDFKGIIEASPWIWHGVQVLALLNFLRGVYWKINWYAEQIIFSFLGSLYGWMFYSFGIISIEGFLIILFYTFFSQ